MHHIYHQFLDNKHTATYLRIVGRAKNRKLDDYTEEHHVLPEALGGSNEQSNLVKLTAREHFICHLLLLKMIVGHDRSKMAFAAFMMGCSNERQERYKVTGRVYELVKREFSKARGELNTKLWADPEFRAKMLSKWTEERVEWYREMGRERLADPAVRAEYAARTDELWKDPEYRSRQQAATKLACSSEANKARAKAATKELWQSEGYRAKVGVAISQGRQQRKLASEHCSFGDAMNILKLRKPAVRTLIDSGELVVTARNAKGHCKIEKASVRAVAQRLSIVLD